MPKGYKSDKGYATVTSKYGGLDYRTIAEKMTVEGYKMNHATARNVFLRAMKKLSGSICGMYNIEDGDLIDQIARDPRFQQGMVEIMTDIYN